MLQLKTYQQLARDALRDYLRDCLVYGAKHAFIERTERVYKEMRELPGIPYVCLRIPTGGGKTLVACYAATTVARELVHTEKPLVLWLVPTNAIREQTLKALRSRNHPYRQALEELGPVTALDIKEALAVTRSTLDTGTTVIVSTLQAFRVDDTEGRKVYETNGALQPLFSNVSADLLDPEEIREDGSYPFSLANVLRVRRPIVIVDEAHNARTDLSFETLARFQPSCIVEFTATPAQKEHPSNVLYQATAAQLKAADMIKMPIRLWTQRDWKDVLTSAMNKRKELEEAARQCPSDSGIRPILLIQAQASNKQRETLDADVIQKTLIDEYQIPREQCPIATGDKDELKDTDLFDANCPVRFIITKQQLREGWDCSHAYVLCSVAEVRSATAVEQILGRIMRLPGAQKRSVEALNAAYAYVVSASFGEVAAALENGLVENGFERFEANRMIESGEQKTIDDLGEGSLFHDGGQTRSKTPVEDFSVPFVAVRSGDLFERLDETDLIDTEWTLLDEDARFSEAEFSANAPRSEAGEIDIAPEGRLEARVIDQMQNQVAVVIDDSMNSKAALIMWLDKHTRHVEFPQEDFLVFLTKVLEDLMNGRGLALAQLVNARYRLLDAIRRRLTDVWKRVRTEQLQMLLLSSKTHEIVVRPDIPDLCFSFDKVTYPCHQPYGGRFAFRKHYYERISSLSDEGEEFECARHIDGLPEVKMWVRNVVDPKYGFWLPTTAGRFYPDFVCMLTDGRYLVVEHKGLHLWTDAESKRTAGELWELKSDGRCLFAMTKGKSNAFGEIEARVRSSLIRTGERGQVEIH